MVETNNNLTYEQLAWHISTMSPEQRAMYVTVKNGVTGEQHELERLHAPENGGDLDKRQPLIVIRHWEGSK